MARVTKVEYVDDLNGETIPGDEHVNIKFGFGEVMYEMDLGKESAAEIQEIFDRLISVARPVTTRAGRKPTATRTAAGKVREWAAANGYAIASRGRIPDEVQDAYAAAHGN